MKDLKFTVFGVIAVLTVLGLNFRHAQNDYGVLRNKLRLEVLAQSNTNGAGTTGGVTITCSGGTYGDCQTCVKYELAHVPGNQTMWGFKCIKTGDPINKCASGCYTTVTTPNGNSSM